MSPSHISRVDVLLASLRDDLPLNPFVSAVISAHHFAFILPAGLGEEPVDEGPEGTGGPRDIVFETLLHRVLGQRITVEKLSRVQTK